MDATLGFAKEEAEVAFTGGIDPAAVVSIYDRNKNLTGYRNPAQDKIDWVPGDRQYVRPDSGPGAPAASSEKTTGGTQSWGSLSTPSFVHPVHRPFGLSSMPFSGYVSPHDPHHPSSSVPHAGASSPHGPPISFFGENSKKKKWWKFGKGK
ncbi:MAG TPA: hypothetical protein VFG87_13495 [Amycolatopsis sp.]|nr:hypothetical protein [Amycolatopsis sp.]